MAKKFVFTSTELAADELNACEKALGAGTKLDFTTTRGAHRAAANHLIRMGKQFFKDEGRAEGLSKDACLERVACDPDNAFLVRLACAPFADRERDADVAIEAPAE
jgi:hypothetical protein